MTNRILIVLITATLVLQVFLLFRGGGRPGPGAKQEFVVQAPKGTVLDLTDVPLKGKEQAELVLVEFSDYECPFCIRHSNEVGPQIQKEYVDTGKLRYGFANNPLPFHPNAEFLATAAICSGQQGQYWEMHDLLFTAKPKKKEEVLALLPRVGPTDSTRFQECLNTSADAARQIESDKKKAKMLGLSGTPSFALGRTTSDGKVEVEKLIKGAGPFHVFQREIGDSLAKLSH